MGKKFYETLNIAENASEDEIKKAYKKLAVKYHPDKNQNNKEEAEKKFKEITEAYEVLSDSEKKKMYDQLGDAGFSQQQQGNGMNFTNPMDLFAQMFGFNMGGDMDGEDVNINMPGFGGGNPFSFFFNGGNQSNDGGDNLQDIVIRKEITLKQLYTQEVINLDFERQTFCINCSASGTKNGKKGVCKTCNGTGRTKVVHQMGHMYQQIISECNQCQGTGKYIEKGNECNVCSGSGMIPEKVNTMFKLDRKMLYDKQIKLPIHGNKNIKGKTSKVFLVLKANPKYKNLELRGSHMFTQINISLAEALSGFIYHLDFVDDKKITLKREIVTQPGSVWKIPRMGFMEDSFLFVLVNVILPEFVPKEVLEVINKTYGKEKTATNTPTSMNRIFNLEIQAEVQN